jgi:hypothetical protein
MRVHDHEVERLRDWFAELMQRQDEVRETFRNEGVRHEKAYLLRTAEGVVLIYAAEMEDAEAAHRAHLASRLPIDLEHREVMQAAQAEPADADVVYDVRL